MNIFGVGGAEVVVIIMIMLIVAGPKRMIRWAFVIGQYVGKFRMLWSQMVDVMQDEVDAAGLDVKLPREIPTKQNLAQTAGAFMKPYTQSLENTLDEVAQPIKETMQETDKTFEEAKKEIKSNPKELVNKANKANKNVAFTPPSPQEESVNVPKKLKTKTNQINFFIINSIKVFK